MLEWGSLWVQEAGDWCRKAILYGSAWSTQNFCSSSERTSTQSSHCLGKSPFSVHSISVPFTIPTPWAGKHTPFVLSHSIPQATIATPHSEVWSHQCEAIPTLAQTACVSDDSPEDETRQDISPESISPLGSICSLTVSVTPMYAWDTHNTTLQATADHLQFLSFFILALSHLTKYLTF